MLEYDKIVAPEEIDVNKTNGLHYCIICHYWYFHEINFRFHTKVCNDCHDLMQKAISLMMLKLFLLKEMIMEFIFNI